MKTLRASAASPGSGLWLSSVLPTLLLVPPIGLARASTSVDLGPPPADVELFTRMGCPRCAAAEQLLQALQREQPALRFVVRRIDREPDALRRLGELAAHGGVSSIGVPAFYVRGALLIGFVSDEITGTRIRALIAGSGGALPQAGGACTADATGPCAGAEDVDRITLPFFGPLAAPAIGLPLFTIIIGLLDGFNPCAMWLLLFLLSLLVNVHDRTKMLLIAGTFVVSSGLVYFAFMAAWLNIFMLIGFSIAVRVVLGTVAVVVGLVNVKDFFAYHPGRLIVGSVPVLKPRELIALLEAHGFTELRQRGPHKQFRHADGLHFIASRVQVAASRHCRAGTRAADAQSVRRLALAGRSLR